MLVKRCFMTAAVLLSVASTCLTVQPVAAADATADGSSLVGGPVVGVAGANELEIGKAGTMSPAIIVVAPAATVGRHERAAADELADSIALMLGSARPVIADTPESIAAALVGKAPVLLIGSEALKARPALAARLQKAAKPNPVLRADAVGVVRDGNRVYLAGLSDDSNFHAVVWLLREWGCRWYLPGAFGACIPSQERLAVGAVDMVYASPFELRTYWNAWNGYGGDMDAYRLHNFMTTGIDGPGGGHNLARFTADLAEQKGTSVFGIPVADPETIAHVAAKLDEVFKNGGTESIAIEDGIYTSQSAEDLRLKAGLWDKYMMVAGMSDVFMTFYNGVAENLLKKYPDSKAKLGFLAYSNLTMPPQAVMKAAPPLVAALAPIDIDPIHGMDSELSPSRREYRAMMQRWAEVMQGRVWVYDYDQGMLVWRDMPNPSHQAFRQDVKHYRDAGIIGFATESRNAVATIFLNLHIRGQLMWNPDADTDAILADFYPRFYGVAAPEMEKYWGAIYAAWDTTLVTEHEFFVIPAIYTPELVAELETHLIAAETLAAPLAGKADATRQEKQVLERLAFTRAAFKVIKDYTDMVRLGASEGKFADAAAKGREALDARWALSEMNPNFTTRVTGADPEPKIGGSPAWFPGEVQYYADIAALTDGTAGKLVTLLPLEWAFHRDPRDSGMSSDWSRSPIDLTHWEAVKATQKGLARKDYDTTQWEMLRTDIYPQAQGILHPDGQSFTGFCWYRTTVTLDAAQAAQPIHALFPGIFGDTWIWVNGQLVGHRPQNSMWWFNDYSFKWDADLRGSLKPGENTIAVRCYNSHHVTGMWRRPFLYVPTPAAK